MIDKIESYLKEYKEFSKKVVLEFTGKIISDDDEKLLDMVKEKKKEILNILENGVDIGSLIKDVCKVKDIVIKDDEYYFKLDLRSKYNLYSFREALR